MNTKPYQDFAKEKLGFEFHDISLLVTALTHRSYVNEHSGKIEHNERLEFLGDAVLELVSSDFLFKNYHVSEGIMTSWRAALVRTEANCSAGKEIGYESLIRLSKGENIHGTSRAHDVIIADCYEALIGAIYLDQGYESAKDFIYKHNLSKIDSVLKNRSWLDAKSRFQELAQRIEGTTPSYHILKKDGPDHDITFTTGVYVGGEIRGSGKGHSKQEAEQEAAKEGLAYYKKTHKEFFSE